MLDLKAALVHTQRLKNVIHRHDPIDQSNELMDSELQHAEDDRRVESVISAHFTEDFAADFEALQERVVDLGTLPRHRRWFIINQLHGEASITVVIEVEIAILQDFTIVALRVSALYHTFQFHVHKFD
uniref:Uncharacterized protein n=1 Tax=Favella ehrenbergii TaxID=182087 RepID=A0A7S3I7C0_9SPIT